MAKDSLVRHDKEGIAFADHAGLGLAHGNGAHVLVLVDDAHAEGFERIPGEWVHIVQNFKQCATGVPGQQCNHVKSLAKATMQLRMSADDSTADFISMPPRQALDAWQPDRSGRCGSGS